jgi:tetratricopeptide (TPR) repeat protein
MKDAMRTFVRALCATLMLSVTTGCGSSVTGWIARERDRQGDLALSRTNYADASLAYQLALKVQPKDEHASRGLVSVQLHIAQAQFAGSRLEDAIESLMLAARYSPDDERIDAMRSEIEQAEIKREIVVSNYPAYRVIGAGIRRSYDNIKEQSAAISLALRRFNYTYDTEDLTKAIDLSYALNSDIARYTNRLVQYRQLVESGAPESSTRRENLSPPASLLPLP